MSKEKPSGEAVASFIMAKDQASRVQAYLTRGRRFEKLTDSELGEKYLEGMREFASDPTNSDRRLLFYDVHAEYDLRGSELPSGAAAELEEIVAATTAVYEQMSDERKALIEAEMQDEYASAKKEEH